MVDALVPGTSILLSLGANCGEEEYEKLWKQVISNG